MQKGMISIIVPAYNAEKYIKKCIESIIRQTYQNIEIIVVDDGSEDSTYDICFKLATLDSRIKLYHTCNNGVSAARNYALNKASGEYIGFVDSDDWIEPDMYQTLIHLLMEYEADIAISPFVLCYPESEKSKKYVNTEKVNVYTNKEYAIEIHKGKVFAGQLGNKLIRRELIRNIRFNKDIYIYEDMLMCWDMIPNMKKAVYIDKHFYHYRNHSQSAMRKNIDARYMTCRDAAKLMMQKAAVFDLNCFRYATSTLIDIDLKVATKLAASISLEDDLYADIRNEILEFKDRSVHLGRKEEALIKALIANKKLFCIIIFMKERIRRIKNKVSGY